MFDNGMFETVQGFLDHVDSLVQDATLTAGADDPKKVAQIGEWQRQLGRLESDLLYKQASEDDIEAVLQGLQKQVRIRLYLCVGCGSVAEGEGIEPDDMGQPRRFPRCGHCLQHGDFWPTPEEMANVLQRDILDIAESLPFDMLETCDEVGSDQGHCSHGCRHEQDSDGSCLRQVAGDHDGPPALNGPNWREQGAGPLVRQACHAAGVCTCETAHEDLIQEIDVRLQVHVDESCGDVSWSIHSGDSSYDQDHRGYWGAGVVDSEQTSTEVAQDLINQAIEHYAQSILAAAE